MSAFCFLISRFRTELYKLITLSILAEFSLAVMVQVWCNIKVMTKVKKGIYRHFKGNLYEVLGMAKNSENLEEEWVVYRPLYKSEVVTDLCIRPKDMFLETIERDGKKIKRFKFIEKK